MLLWSSGEDGEERDLCASISISNGEVRAVVSLQYLGESMDIGSFTFTHEGASGRLIGGMQASPEMVAGRIRLHIESMGDPILVECDRRMPEVPAYLARPRANYTRQAEYA
jgi:hypothetical protein